MTALEILEKIKAEIKKTYYSQGEGFDDYSDGFIRAKNEDLKILDCFLTRAKWQEKLEWAYLSRRKILYLQII